MIIRPVLRSFLVLVIISISCTILIKAEDDYEDDDYFYDAGLTDDDVKQIQIDKKKEIDLKKKLETTKKATTPAFMAVKEKTEDQEMDWNKYYMEKMVKTYMKKYQNEQMEKRRLKFESDLNHPLLSIITLTTFFGVSSVIGLIIVYVRGKQFRKNDSSKFETQKIYNPVEQNETPNVTV